MKAATVRELKQELGHRSSEELLNICLALSKFKKENKELLTYLLYEADNETGYITGIKTEITQEFSEINTKTYYFMKKSIRKILRNTKKYIRYSKKKETEIELLLHFCSELKYIRPSMSGSVQLVNLYQRQLTLIKKSITSLHEDLQYDYNLALEEL